MTIPKRNLSRMKSEVIITDLEKTNNDVVCQRLFLTDLTVLSNY